MPRFSAFAPLGMLAFSARPSHAEAIYGALRSALGTAYDLSPGTHEEAKLYARAMGFARVRHTVERAGVQKDPRKATELLPLHEEDFGVVPSPNATVGERRAVVTARYLLSRGAVRENIVEALRQALGRDFLAYRTLTPSEVTQYPQDTLWGSPNHPWGSGHWGGVGPVNFARADLPPKFLELRDPAATLRAPLWVAYANSDVTAAPVSLEAGEAVVVEPENTALAERVRVLAIDEANGERRFQAMFRKGHAPGASVTTMSWPWLTSTQRFALIVVTERAALDAESRRRVHELMGRIARGVSQWGIVVPTSPTTLGPFVLGSTPLGTSPLAPFPFVPS